VENLYLLKLWKEVLIFQNGITLFRGQLTKVLLFFQHFIPFKSVIKFVIEPVFVSYFEMKIIREKHKIFKIRLRVYWSKFSLQTRKLFKTIAIFIRTHFRKLSVKN